MSHLLVNLLKLEVLHGVRSLLWHSERGILLYELLISHIGEFINFHIEGCLGSVMLNHSLVVSTEDLKSLAEGSLRLACLSILSNEA